MTGRGRIRTFLGGDESGVAAIEMALVLPFLLFLFFGMIDAATLLSDNRKLSYSANAVADLVTKLESPTTAEKIADAFKAVEIVMKTSPSMTVRVEVYNYRKNVSNVAVPQWVRNNGKGTPCTQPVTTNLTNLMAAGNDIIIAVTCTDYQPVMARLIGRNTLGSLTFKVREQIATRPRFSLLLDCTNCSS